MADAEQGRLGRLADSVAVRLTARAAMLAMAPVFALTLYFGQGWLEGKFGALGIDQIKLRIERVEFARQADATAIQVFQTELAVMRANQASNDIALERWRNETNVKLDRLNDSVNSLIGTISGLNATLQAVQRDADRQK